MRRLLIVPVALILLLAGCAANNNAPASSDSNANAGAARQTAAPKVASTPKPKANAAQLVAGAVARTGQFSISLVSITDPWTSSNQFEQPQAGSRDVVYHVTVTNVDKHQHDTNEFNFTLKTTDNHVYNIGIGVGDSALRATPLGAGDIAEGDVGFTIPQDAQPMQLKYDGGFGNDDLTWTAVPH